MRDYAKISTSLWQSDKFLGLSSDKERLAYIYIHTCQHANSIGCYRLPLGYMSVDLGWTEAEARKALIGLSEALLIDWNQDKNIVSISGFFDHSPITNGKHAMGAVKLLANLPDCNQKRKINNILADDSFCADMLEYIAMDSSMDSPMDTYDTETETERETETKAKKIILKDAFEDFWKAYPRKIGKGNAERAYSTSLKTSTSKQILEGLARYVDTTAGTEQKYIKHPSTWLNGKCWLDEPDVVPQTLSHEKQKQLQRESIERIAQQRGDRP